MEVRSKAETFIGFAMRAGKYKIGANACATLKRAYLIIACKSASENSLDEARKLARKFGCGLIVTTEKKLCDYTHRENSKIMAVSDRDFAKLILDNIEKEFIEDRR